jgi:hypothetical protein
MKGYSIVQLYWVGTELLGGTGIQVNRGSTRVHEYRCSTCVQGYRTST